jgi:hypothetical protein
MESNRSVITIVKSQLDTMIHLNSTHARSTRVRFRSSAARWMVVAAGLSMALAPGAFAPGAFAQGTSTATTAANFTNAGASGSVFTKLWIGARASGMAGAYSALANDVTALYWNPAGIATLPGINVGASYTSWFAGVTENFIAATLPVSERYRAGFALTVVDYGSLQKSTIQQDANAGIYNANDLSFAATIAGSLTDRFSFGATAKFLRSSILDMSADGIAFDAGSLYLTDFYHMTISMDLSNLGADRNFSGNSLDFIANNPNINAVRDSLAGALNTGNFPLPLIFRIGLASDLLQGKVENQKLNMDFDFSTHSDGPEQYNLGAEYIWNDMAAFRAGYAFNQDQLGLGVGAGFHFKTENFSGIVDYSYNTTKSLGGINRISISATFQ